MPLAEMPLDLGPKPFGTGKGPRVLIACLGPKAGSVPREPQVTEGDLLLRKSPVEQGLKEVVMLHPFGEAVSDEDQCLACCRLQWQRCGGGRGVERRGLMVGGPLLVDLLLLQGRDRGEDIDRIAAA